MVCPVRNALNIFDHFMFRKMNAWPRYYTKEKSAVGVHYSCKSGENHSQSTK